MPYYISVKEAAKLVKRSEVTVRRFIRKIMFQQLNEYSDNIKMEELKKGFIYKIDKDFLLEQFKDIESGTNIGLIDDFSDELPPLKKKDDRSDYLPLHHPDDDNLSDQITKSLLNQLAKKDEQIAALMDQLRDMNVIIKQLQEKILNLQNKDDRKQNSNQSKTDIL